MKNPISQLKQILVHACAQHYVRFLVIGGVNTIFGYSCYALAVGFLHLSLPVALLVSQIAGILFNFNSYGRLVFESSHASRDKFFTFIRFLLAYGITYGINLGLLKLMVAYDVSAYLAQALSLIVVVPVSYLILRYYVWRKQPKL